MKMNKINKIKTTMKMNKINKIKTTMIMNKKIDNF